MRWICVVFLAVVGACMGSGGDAKDCDDTAEDCDTGSESSSPGPPGGRDESGATSSCFFGESICIEYRGADPDGWCADTYGAIVGAGCPEGADYACDIPAHAHSDYDAPATAYYYGVAESDVRTACETVGGSLR
jgi:hypothetical protein